MSLNTRISNLKKALSPKFKGLQWLEGDQMPAEGFIGVRWLTSEEVANQDVSMVSGRYRQNAD